MNINKRKVTPSTKLLKAKKDGICKYCRNPITVGNKIIGGLRFGYWHQQCPAK